jgi:hypothetical protein
VEAISAPTTTHTAGGDGGAISYHFTQERTPISVALRAVAFDTHRAFAVGDHGNILTRTPTSSWTMEVTPTDQDLRSISPLSGERRVFVVGAGGTILVLDPAGTFRVDESPTREDLNSVMVTWAHVFYAVGTHGTLLVHRADRWQQIPTGVDTDFFAAVECDEGGPGAKRREAACVGGRNGVVLKCETGEQPGCAPIATPGKVDIWASPEYPYFVGAAGLILKLETSERSSIVQIQNDSRVDLVAASHQHWPIDDRSGRRIDPFPEVALGNDGTLVFIYGDRGREAIHLAGGLRAHGLDIQGLDCFIVGDAGTVIHGTLDGSIPTFRWLSRDHK